MNSDKPVNGQRHKIHTNATHDLGWPANTIFLLSVVKGNQLQIMQSSLSPPVLNSSNVPNELYLIFRPLHRKQRRTSHALVIVDNQQIMTFNE